MKIVIDVNNLREALTGQISAKSTSDIWEHALLECEGETLTLSTRNASSQYSVSVGCEVIEPGNCTANPMRLKNTVTGLEGNVTLKHAEGRLEVVQQVEKRTRKFSLNTLAAAAWPALPKEELEPLNIDMALLLEGIKQVFYAAAKTDVRRMLNGVLIGQDSVAASDGHRMAVFPLKSNEDFDIIVPRDNTAKIITLLEHDDAEIFINKLHHNLLHIKANNLEFVTSLIDCKYFNLKRMMPDNEQTFTYAFKASDAKAVVNRCRSLELRKVEKAISSRIIVKAMTGALNFFGKVADDFMPCNCEPHDQELGIDARYLSDALAVIGDDNVQWKHSGVMTKQTLQSTKSPTLHIIMPMQL